MNGSPLFFVVFIIIVLGAFYAAYLQAPRDVPSTDTSNVTSGKFFEWFLPPGVARQVATTTVTSPLAPGVSVPSGFNAQDLSPYFGKVTIVAVVPAKENAVAEMIIQGASDAPKYLAGWVVRSRTGSQIIGTEGQNFIRQMVVPVINKFLNEQHDRLLLLDGQGKMVDEYVY